MDQKTKLAYQTNAKEYSQDWLSQQEPIDIYDLVKRYFIPNGETADIGCGNGRDVNWLTQSGFSVTGFDISEELLQIARSLYPKSLFKNASLPELKEIETKFDNIFCETVIMHLPLNLISLAIENLKRILKPNGVIYLSWRVTEGEDRRQNDGRLYSAFDSETVLKLFDKSGFLFTEDKISLSSQKRVFRLIWKQKQS
jgi:2-polyprenyl-3-methyl-5-hydroxy-6-metoxy-1,4-benzoquinol methylase